MATVAGTGLRPRPARAGRGQPEGAPTVAPGRVLLPTFLVTMALIPSNLSVGHLGPFGIPQVVVGLLALWWWLVARWHPAGRLARTVGPVHLAVGVFAATALIGSATAFGRVLTSVEASGAVRAPVYLASLVGVCLLAADGLSSRRHLEQLLRLVVGLAAVMAAVGAYEFLTRTHPFAGLQLPGVTNYNPQVERLSYRAGLFRVYSTTTQPIEFAVVMATALPLALYFAVDSPLGRRARDYLALALVAVALPLSISRSAVVGLVLGLGVLVAGWDGRRRAAVAAVALAGLAALRLVIPGLVGTFYALLTAGQADPSIAHRTRSYGVAAGYIHASPWLGRGFGTFSALQYGVLDNQYLLTVVETGLVGLAALVGLFALALRAARQARARSADPAARSLCQALLAALTVETVSLLFYDGFAFRISTGLLFFLIGAVAALPRLLGDPDRA